MNTLREGNTEPLLLGSWCNWLSLTKRKINKGRQRTYNETLKACSCKHCCGEKAIRITYSERVFVALGIQHAMRMSSYYILICGLSWFYHIVLHYLINGTIFGGGEVIDNEMCVAIFSTTFVWNIFHSKKNWARYYHKCISVCMQSTRYFCHILNTI